MDQEIFSDLKIDCGDVFDTDITRYKCPKCDKSRKYFCFICNVALCGIENIPRLELPIKIDIIKHAAEFHGKSTSCHAPILAPEDVTIHKFPVIPDYNCNETLLLLPGENAKSLTSYASMKDKLSSIKRVVVIDCTWNQVILMGKDERLKDIPRIELSTHEGHYWRHKGEKPSTYLSTIEAIYYLCVEWHQVIDGTDYDGRYDNLLFYFKYLYDKLYRLTEGGSSLKAFSK